MKRIYLTVAFLLSLLAGQTSSLAVQTRSSVPSALIPDPVEKEEPYSFWVPKLTEEFIRNVEEFRPAIIEMLRKEIPTDQSVLEIGSGPLGGVLYYLGDLPNVTPSEPNEEAFVRLQSTYPRAIKTSAQEVDKNVTQKYDVVLFTNSMDCVMSDRDEEIRRVLGSVKKILNPGGRVIILQYYNPVTDFIYKYILDRENAYLAMPFQEMVSVDGGFRFSEQGVTLIHRSKLDVKFPFGTEMSLRGMIAENYLEDLHREFYEHPNASFARVLRNHGAFSRFSSMLDQMRHLHFLNDPTNFNMKKYKETYGLSQLSLTKIFIQILEDFSKKSGFSFVSERHKVSMSQGTVLPGGDLDTTMLFAYNDGIRLTRPIGTSGKPSLTLKIVYTMAVLTPQ